MTSALPAPSDMRACASNMEFILSAVVAVSSRSGISSASGPIIIFPSAVWMLAMPFVWLCSAATTAFSPPACFSSSPASGGGTVVGDFAILVRTIYPFFLSRMMSVPLRGCMVKVPRHIGDDVGIHSRGVYHEFRTYHTPVCVNFPDFAVLDFHPLDHGVQAYFRPVLHRVFGKRDGHLIGRGYTARGHIKSAVYPIGDVRLHGHEFRPLHKLYAGDVQTLRVEFQHGAEYLLPPLAYEKHLPFLFERHAQVAAQLRIHCVAAVVVDVLLRARGIIDADVHHAAVSGRAAERNVVSALRQHDVQLVGGKFPRRGAAHYAAAYHQHVGRPAVQSEVAHNGFGRLLYEIFEPYAVDHAQIFFLVHGEFARFDYLLPVVGLSREQYAAAVGFGAERRVERRKFFAKFFQTAHFISSPASLSHLRDTLFRLLCSTALCAESAPQSSTVSPPRGPSPSGGRNF